MMTSQLPHEPQPSTHDLIVKHGEWVGSRKCGACKKAKLYRLHYDKSSYLLCAHCDVEDRIKDDS